MNKKLKSATVIIILLIAQLSFGQKLNVNGEITELKELQTNIVQFDLGTELNIKGIVQSADKFKFKILPLKHGKSEGYVTVSCSEKQRELGKTIRTNKTKQIQTQSQRERTRARPTNNLCNSNFTLVTKETDCFNRILIHLIAKFRSSGSKVYIIELRPNQRCD